MQGLCDAPRKGRDVPGDASGRTQVRVTAEAQAVHGTIGGSMPGGGRGHGVFQVQEEDGAEEEYQEDQWIEAVGGKGSQKCNKRGKAGHFAKECPTDMTKVKCFKCGHEGHIGANCKSASSKAKAKPLAKPKPKAQSKGSPRKTQGKGKGKGKKGKLNEVGEGEA